MPPDGAGRERPIIHVCCAADGPYIPHSAAMIHSVLAHRGQYGAHIHYLHGSDLEENTIDLLRALVEDSGGTISFLAFNDHEVARLPFNLQSSAAAWYRMVLPELLPEVDRVIYLDADTIVVDSLQPLWQVDVSGSLIGAVTNVLPPGMLKRPAQLGLAGPEAYFNAGVLLFNLDEIRRRGLVSELREYALQHGGDLLWRDQDVLNLVLGGSRVRLHPRWNVMNGMLSFEWASDVLGADALEEARSDPGIRHFEGPLASKPWYYLCEQEMREAYFEHRRRTPWPSCAIEGVTPHNRAKRVLREILQIAPARWEREGQIPVSLWKRIGRR
ncbi:MAG: glycosyltransferase family 8 protein [Gemmatimonadaceae bacterium]